MTIAGAPLASAPEQNSAYARNKEGRFGKPGRPSLCVRLNFDGINGITEFRHEEHEGLEGEDRGIFWTGLTRLTGLFKYVDEGSAKKNPIQLNGYRKDRLHSHASGDYGILRVRERIEGTLTCLKIATNKRKFDSLYARAFPPKSGDQADWIDDQEL